MLENEKRTNTWIIFEVDSNKSTEMKMNTMFSLL